MPRKKKVVEQPVPVEETTPVEVIPEPEPAPVVVPDLIGPHPSVHIGVDRRENGYYEYVLHPRAGQHERYLFIEGERFDHVAEDTRGIWLYRISRG